jgi:hypothetical protein
MRKKTRWRKAFLRVSSEGFLTRTTGGKSTWPIMEKPREGSEMSAEYLRRLTKALAQGMSETDTKPFQSNDSASTM